MSVFNWMNEKVNKYDWLDIGCIKWGSMAFILMVAKFWPSILSLEWHWYGIIFVVCVIKLFRKMFSK